MARSKSKDKNIFNMIWEGTKLYFANFINMSECMVFPVFGQLLAVFWILGLTVIYTQNIESLAGFIPGLSNNIFLVFLLLAIIVAPGFLIFVKAFWEYMIVCVSMNLLCEDAIRGRQTKEGDVYNKIVKLRTKDYITVLTIIALLWLAGMLVPLVAFLAHLPSVYQSFLFIVLECFFIFSLTILTIYLSLTLQVFAFENYRSPVETLKRSIKLISGNFWRTTFLGIILGLITTLLIPAAFQTIIEGSFLMKYLSYPSMKLVEHLMQAPRASTFMWMNPSMATAVDPFAFMANLITLTIIGAIITAFILPYGTSCYALLYKDIIYKREKKFKKK